MKNKALFSVLLLTVVLTVLSSCDPTLMNEGGRKVKFTASSANSQLTKTSNGRLATDYWTINWVSGDQLRIYSPNTGTVSGSTGTATVPTDPSQGLDYSYSDYSIDAITTSGHVSKATLKNVDANGLSWMSDQTATFYGAYPKDVQICSTLPDSDGKYHLRFAVEIPDAGTSGQTGVRDDVSKMPLLAIQTVPDGGDVTLDFYPAFSTYELELLSYEGDMTIYSVTFSSGTTTDYVTGICYYDLNKLPAGSHFLPNTAIDYESGNSSITFDFGTTGKNVSTTQALTLAFFTLPRAYTNPKLTVDFSVNGSHRYSRTLVLKKTDADLTFPAGNFAKINAVQVKGEICFKTITINGVAAAWDSTAVTPALMPQTSQFNVKPQPTDIDDEGVNHGVYNVFDKHEGEDPTDPDFGKQYRQYWVIPQGKTATVSFKIITPKTGTYTITPVGDTDSFTVTGNLSGNIEDLGTTRTVSFQITPTTTANKSLHFNTTVTSGGVTYNIDSETQLFDIRGYHYFVTVDPLI